MSGALSTRARVVLGSLGLIAALAAVLVVRHSRHVRARPTKIRREHPHFALTVTAEHFLRGNVHTHSTRSDGTEPLEAMVGWYRDHGYAFLAMTEHGLRLDPAELAPLSSPGFVVIPGEEVTDSWADHPLHVNALCARATVPDKARFDRAEEGLAAMLAAIRAQGGVPLVNHPNYGWSLEAGDIERGASGRYLLEIWSGLPGVHSGGDGSHPSEEAIWSDVLESGADAIPAAVDDAHGLHEGQGGSDALPGRGWIETFGDEIAVPSICAALAEGRLIASNGPALARLAVQGDTFLVGTGDAAATVAFLDEQGTVLAREAAAASPLRGGVHEVTYRLTGYEDLVRATITDAAGHQAWTPAYRVTD